METRSSDQTQDGSAIVIAIGIITIIALIACCGCFLAPRATLTPSCASDGASEYAAYWRQMARRMRGSTAHYAEHSDDHLMSPDQSNLHPIAAGYRQHQTQRSAESVSTQRHPMALLLQPSSVSMMSRKLTNNAGFGSI